MNHLILEYIENLKQRIGRQSRVLDIGSLDVNGSPRKFFKDADEYIGIDLEKGKSVDIVASSYDIPKLFKKNSFDCVICCETIEHDSFFWVTIRNMRWVLKPGGWMILSAPSLRQYIHRYPIDCYRFLPDAFETFFFKGFEELNGMMGYAERIINPIPATDLLTISFSGKKPLRGWKETLPI